MKITEAARGKPAPSVAAVIKFLGRAKKDDVFTAQDLAPVAACTVGHIERCLYCEPALKSFTRTIRRRRWWGRPEALDALERAL